MENVTLVIQAGGQSRRMGQDKGLVPLGKRPLIEHVLERVREITPEIIITTNRPDNYRYLGLPLFEDEVPGLGAAFGLQTALQSSSTPFVILVACDMPFVDAPLLRDQLSGLGTRQAAVPRWQGLLQPFHAVYQRKPSLALVQKAIKSRIFSLHRILLEFDLWVLEAEIDSRYTDEDHPFFNVNTPDDLVTAERRLAVIEQKGSGLHPSR